MPDAVAGFNPKDLSEDQRKTWEMQQQLQLMGGDFLSRHWPQRAGRAAEAVWRQALVQEFQQT